MDKKVKELIDREENRLPLTFTYLEFFEDKRFNLQSESSTNYLECGHYQTNFLMRSRPFKKLVRML